MTDYLGQQLEELEVLESIFPEEYSVCSPESPISFQIHVRPDDVEGKEDINTGGEYLILTFTLPETYPDVVPEIEVEGPGLNATHESEVKRRLHALAEENLGMVMCFLLASDAKEWLDSRRDELAALHDARIEQTRIEQEEADRVRHGTLSTRENFIIWRDEFEAEQRMKMARQGFLDLEKEKRPTGRQLFEKDSSLASSDAKFMEEGESVVSVDKKVPVDESLFDEMDGLDLEDN